MRLRPFRPTATMKHKKPSVQLNATATRSVRRARDEDFDDDEEDYYETSEPNMKLSHAFIVVLILHLIAVAGIFGFNSLKNRQNALAKINEEATAPATVAAAETATGATTGATTATTATTNPINTAATAGSSHTVVPGDTLTRIARQHSTTIEALEAANGLTSESILRVGQVLQLPEPGTTVASAPAKPAKPSKPSAQATASTAAPAPATTTAPPAPSTPATTTTTTTTTTAAAAAAAAAPAGAGEAEVYEVVAGDNPYSIARRLGVSYQALVEFNKIEDPTKLQIGQKLKIPR